MGAREDVEQPGRIAAALIALTTAAVLALHLDRPAFFDNEGRYAEVAREMLLRGDFVTPTMDWTLFLNKPPLAYWTTALAFSFVGFTEWARLSTIAVAMVTVYWTCRLGARIWSVTTGLWAGAILATTIGFALEARTLRPDSFIIVSTVGAILFWHRAEYGPAAARTRNLVALYGLLGVGVLAKGLVPIVVAGIPIGVVMLREHGLAAIRRMRPGLGLAVLALVVLPWHVLVALEHPGFAWDYVVNQHLLFFLDKKFPRDSEGDPLPFFWAAFLFRAAPWILVVPFTLPEAWRGLRRGDPAARGAVLAWVWLAGVVGFFSLPPSRLEHYSLPALPAVALLAAHALERLRTGAVGSAPWWWLGLVAALLTGAGLTGLVAGTSLLSRVYWITQVPDFLPLVVPAALAASAGGLVLATAVRRRRPRLVAAGFALVGVPLAAIVLRAQAVAEPLFSWKPVGQVVREHVPEAVPVVFESPEEYQIVGGLVFYSGRRIEMLEPPGFVPPTYLEGKTEEMFLRRADFDRRWQSGERLVFVSDSQKRRDRPDGLVPAPFHVLARFGDRWILANYPVPAAS
ncbi:MAG: glycosyltransferase family 39 protein [bacterium]|nr:glycosyltransferase family 39 protein [bacterium]